MKWHDHPLMFRSLEQIFKNDIQKYKISTTGLSPKSPEEISAAVVQILKIKEKNNRALFNTCAQFQSEAQWITDKRPYYNVCPSVIKPFTNVNLEKIKCSDIHLPLPRLVIRFPIGFELNGAKSIFVAENFTPEKERGLLLAINDGRISENGIPVHTVSGMILDENYTIADRLQYGRDNAYSNDELDNDMVDTCMKLVVAICLLGNDPNLIEGIPLEADRLKWEETHDPLLLQKAEVRGKREWNVGNHIEVAPGYRNPHFAIRWMGHGEPKQPVLRPIKGCLVKRKQIEEIPTGWLDDEQS